MDIHETLPSELLQSLQDTARYHAGSGSSHSIWQLAKRGFLFEEFQKNGIDGIDYDYLGQMIRTVSNEKAKCGSSAITLTQIKGRLLIFDPCATMYDGISEEISHGFFDSDDVPPPEFWVGLYTNRLISFIPEEYFDVVDEVIENSMSGCLEWLGDKFSISI